MTTSVVVEPRVWTSEETFNLISRLELYPELWDVSAEIHKDRYKKISATAALATEFQTDSREITRKLHNMRTQLNNEMRKIRRRKRLSGGLEVSSKWKYFQALKYMMPPKWDEDSVDSSVSQAYPTEELEQEESEIDEPAGNDCKGTVSCTPMVITGLKSTKRSKKQKVPTSTPKIQKTEHCPQTDFSDANEIYDCFGKYVASMLRSIESPTALRLQGTITSYLINAMFPHQPPTNESIDAAGTESSETDDYTSSKSRVNSPSKGPPPVGLSPTSKAPGKRSCKIVKREKKAKETTDAANGVKDEAHAQEDDCTAFGKSVGLELKMIKDNDQKDTAKKLISEALYLAKRGELASDAYFQVT